MRLPFILAFFLFILQFLTVPAASQTVSAQHNRYRECLQLIADDKNSEALQQLKNLIEDYPGFTDAYRKVVELYFLQDDLPGATTYFNNLLKRDSLNVSVLYALARLDFRIGKKERAIWRLKECIRLKPDFAEAYGLDGGLPEVFRETGNMEEGFRFFRELTEISPENAYAYYALGRLYYKRYDWEHAIPLFEKSLKINPDLLYSHFCLFYARRLRSEYDEALKTAFRLYASAKKLNNLEMISRSLALIGEIYYLFGDFRTALEYMDNSLTLARQFGDRIREAGTTNDMGAIYAFLGEWEKGFSYFRTALGLFRKLGVVNREILTLYNMGLVLKDMSRYPQALAYFDSSLAVLEQTGPPQLRRLMLTGKAEVFLEQKKYSLALQNFENALTIANELNDISLKGYILRNLGSLNDRLNKYATAARYHRQALKIGRDIGDAQIIWESEAGLGNAYRKLGETRRALRHFSRAIAIFDSIRKDLDIQSLGSSFLNDKYAVYPSIIQLLASEQKPDSALIFTEKYKAKSLLEILSGGQFLLQQLLPDSIRQELNQIRSQLEYFHGELSGAVHAQGRNKARILELDQKITSLEIRKSSLIRWIRENEKNYYRLISAEPEAPQAICRRILQPDQLVVEFVVGPEKISVFALRADTLVYTEINLNQEGLLSLLTDFSPLLDKNKKLTSGTPPVWNAELADFSVVPAYRLYQVLLGPLENLLKNARRLIIIPDDFLYYIPFEALVTDTSRITHRYDFENADFLLEKFEISYTPSLSLLEPPPDSMRHPSATLLAFGNPQIKPAESDSLDGAGLARGYSLPPLPFAVHEVENLDQILSGTPHSIHTGTGATETLFKQTAAEYQVLHFATHFLVDDRRPLYSRVLLTPSEGMKEDGYLHTFEVFDLKLNADLVVLSACNTALGKLNRGEGLIGISRAFTYAGVPSSLVSLWQVDDASTAEIMKYFYRNLKEGASKSGALRQAKITYLRQASPQAKDPFYWAGFILTGDMRPIRFIENGRGPAIGWILPVAIFLALFLAYLYRKSRKK